MENIQKMGLSYGLQGGGQGGDIFLEALGLGEHTTYSLGEGCKVRCHMGGVEKAGWEGTGRSAKFSVITLSYSFTKCANLELIQYFGQPVRSYKVSGLRFGAR